MKFTAAILNESCKPLVIDEVENLPLEAGQVLVQIHRSGICGAQINEIDAVKGPDRFLPHLLGHEGGGVVMEIGPGVTHVKPGDHVCMHWRKGLGIHAQGAKYKWNGKTVNSGWVTTFTEYSVVSENRVTPVPEGTPFEIAALMGCAVTTALGAAKNDAKLSIGESAVIFGVGGVGLCLVQAAVLSSAHPVIAVDVKDGKLEMAKKFGATHTINSTNQDPGATIKDILPDGPDVVFETTGITKIIETSYNIAAKKGRIICVGVPKSGQDITIHSLKLHFGKVLTGCEGGQTEPSEDIPRYLRLYDAGKLDLDELVTHRFPLEKVNDGLDALRSGDVGRCMLEMSH